MSENKHTNEPWPHFTDIATTMTPDPEGTPVAILSWDDYIRARACVNACAGIDTDQLETGSINKSLQMFALESATYRRQRDELLAAAEAIEIYAEECMDFDDCTAMLVPIDDYHKRMEAIAGVKGGAE